MGMCFRSIVRYLFERSIIAVDEQAKTPAAQRPQQQKQSLSGQQAARRSSAARSDVSSDISSEDETDSESDAEAMQDDTAADPDASGDDDDALDEAARKAANVKALLNNRCPEDFAHQSRLFAAAIWTNIGLHLAASRCAASRSLQYSR